MAAAAAEPKPDMSSGTKRPAAQFDLTSTLTEYLDIHLVFPILDFVEIDGNEFLKYDPIDIQKARLEFVKPTNMVEYAIEIYNAINNTEEAPAAMNEQHEAVLKQLDAYEKADQKLPTFFADLKKGVYQGVIKTSKGQEGGGQPLTLAWLKENSICDEARLEEYYKHAKFEYECGQYPVASEMLSNFLMVEEHTPANPHQSDLGFQALWGKFAALMLLPEDTFASKWDLAMAEFENLKSAIDARAQEIGSKAARSNSKQNLQQRTWLLHWSLFLFWNHPKGRDEIIGAFMAEKYLQAIQINAPWLLRYLTTAIIINKRRRSELGNVVKIIKQERYTHSDPITQFLECLLVDFDFDGAQEMLGECQQVLKADYFLCNCTDEFVKAARFLIFETYCRIHQKIDLKGLAENLKFDTVEEAEAWIVHLIRTANLDAKIDSSNNCVVMGSNFPSVYQQVINKTKDLSIRTAQLSSGIDRLQKAEAQKAAAEARLRAGKAGGGYDEYDD